MDTDGEVVVEEVAGQEVPAVATHVVPHIVEGDVSRRSYEGSMSSLPEQLLFDNILRPVDAHSIVDQILQIV